jgi:4,5-dihydroxyphthalate decarboxylase
MLELSIAVGDYDRMRPLTDGAVPIDGVTPRFLLLSPEELFFRAFRHTDFDVCELSLSSFAVRSAKGDNPYIGIPVFPSRAFRHSSFIVRTDRGIRAPADLAGRRLGTPEYQLTACVWARALLQEDYAVRPEQITWVRGGLEDCGRQEKIQLNLPAGVRIEDAPPHRTLSQLLSAGEIDGIVSPRFPSCFERGEPNIGWLFDNPQQEAEAWFGRTRIFPIMHIIGIRRSLVERHPWLPATLLKAFSASKARALEQLSDVSASKVTLPFVEAQLVRARTLMGADFWSYGWDEANRRTLDMFLRHHHEQGLSQRRLSAEELFHPAALETYRV